MGLLPCHRTRRLAVNMELPLGTLLLKTILKNNSPSLSPRACLSDMWLRQGGVTKIRGLWGDWPSPHTPSKFSTSVILNASILILDASISMSQIQLAPSEFECLDPAAGFFTEFALPLARAHRSPIADTSIILGSLLNYDLSIFQPHKFHRSIAPLVFQASSGLRRRFAINQGSL